MASTDTPTGPSSPRGDGWGAHNDEVAKGANQREVLAETANESPLAYDGTTVEKALNTVASVADVQNKDEGEIVSAEASAAKAEMTKKLDKEQGTEPSDTAAGSKTVESKTTVTKSTETKDSGSK